MIHENIKMWWRSSLCVLLKRVHLNIIYGRLIINVPGRGVERV